MADRSKSPGKTAESSQRKETGSTEGPIPAIDKAGFMKFVPFFLVVLTIPRAIGFGIAFAIYKYGKTQLYDKNMAVLKDHELGYLYLAAVVMGFLVSWINNYPMLYKNMVMRMNSGNLRANMMFYKQAGAGADAPYVVLETEGPVGSYNRANRSLTHFTENSAPLLVTLVLAGYVFPFPTLVLVLVFALGRILHQAGYAASGYGGHAGGFALAMISGVSLEMLCFLTAAKSLGIGLGPLRLEL
eukprot:TRINITY_DN26509_c0_g1_i1.p1 TRINITY_DN26509_c0_g1~~TRINITY_DN26509_c0_g1_i1.p1  ORF type:complete len:243 (+),score=38.22 TRINITY_DN26509_c0_g1_i1:199-927(+)